jgi:hypothetical protein
MVQDFTNFMDPSGGLFRNGYVDGVQGLFAGVAADIVAPILFNSLEKSDIRATRARLGLKIRNTYNNPRSATFSSNYMNTVHGSGGSPYSYGGKGTVNWKQNRARIQSRIADVKARYGRARIGMKRIGWGYAALVSAQIFEAVAAPSLESYAATRSNESVFAENSIDGPVAYTQRQRALLAIHDSQLGIRGVISQEAGYFHK